MCELLREPSKAVITDSIPEFDWIFPTEGQYQSAYRLIAASALELLEEDRADIWDSKKVSSSKSIDIVYEGKALKEKTPYFWKVKVWGSTNATEAWEQYQ